MDSLVREGLNEINLSIDAVGDKHDFIRGMPGLFAKLEQIIGYIKNKYPLFKIKVEAVVMKENYNEIPELIKWASNYQIYSFTLKELEDFGKNYEKLRISEEKKNELLHEVSGLNTNMILDKDLIDPEPRKQCNYLLRKLRITSQKKIIPCNIDLGNNFYLNRSIKELYKDPSFRNHIWNQLNNCMRCYNEKDRA